MTIVAKLGSSLAVDERIAIAGWALGVAVAGGGAFELPEARAPRLAPRERDRTHGVLDANDAGQVVLPEASDVALRETVDAAMDRYADGDDTAFEVLYDELSPRLFAFLSRSTRDRARVEDVVQQTMLQIHRARGSFRRGARVLPWAFAIARRLLIDQHRRGAKEVLLAEGVGDGIDALRAVDALADDVAVAKQLAERLSMELSKLPENQRAAFELIKQDGLSVSEAAEVLGTTVAAVKLRAHRAYEALRAAIADLTRADKLTEKRE